MRTYIILCSLFMCSHAFSQIDFFHDSERGFDEIVSTSTQSTLFRPVMLVKNSQFNTIQYKMITPAILNKIFTSVDEVLYQLAEKTLNEEVDKNFIPCLNKTSVFNTRLVTEHIYSTNNSPTPYESFFQTEKLRHLGIILSNSKCKENKIQVKLSFQTSGTWPNFIGSLSLSDFKNKKITWIEDLE
jgi:hypothetical protein